MRLDVVTYCKDYDNRGDPAICPMCWETYVEYEYCCKYGVKKEE